MRNPHILAHHERVADIGEKNSKKLLAQTGSNTGNLLFISAVRRIAKYRDYSSGYKFDPARIAEMHDGIVIPAANWVQASKDYGWLANLIEKSKLPCVLVGLGAQSLHADRIPKLTPGTLRFLQVVSERSTSISVRGEFTATVLEKFGVKNVRVTGCPSLMWWVNRPVSVQKVAKRISDVVMHSTRSDEAKSQSSNSRYRTSLYITQYAYKKKLDYVAQTELSDIVISRNNDLSGVAWDMIHMAYAEKDSDKVSAHIKKHIKCFFSVDEWVAFMTTKDFSFGTRLHGTIAALLAGKPAMLVTHDTRTREMARWAAIPCIDESEVLRKTEIDFQGIYDDLDFSEFNERQKSYYSEFCEFFDENEIDHNLCRSVTAS